MSYIRKSDYAQDRIRPKIAFNYVEQMKRYLELKYPDQSKDLIDAFVKRITTERYKSPDVEALVHKVEGESTHVKGKLDKYTVEVIRDNNLAPSGTCYYPVSKKESFLRLSIEAKIKERNAFKKLYLDYEAQGQKRESQYYYLNQANAKIFNNAIAGGMNASQFILSCKPGFNAITSMGRMCVKQGYSFIERAVNGNIYLPRMDDAISYVINHVRHIPQSFIELHQQNILYQPSVEDIAHYLVTSVANYTTKLNTNTLTKIIEGLDATQRAYVFYAGCINNLCRFNETMMRSWIDSCFLSDTLDPTLYSHIDLDNIKAIPGDVIACVLSTNYKHLGNKGDKADRWNSLKDAAKTNPEGLKSFIYCCQHFIKQFEKMVYVLKPILQIETTFSKMTFQHKMARYTVPLSDTDSNIFSTQELIRWKVGKIDFSLEAYQMNAMVTFIMSQSLEHVFGRLASAFGVEGKDVFRISMKNEFLYPIMIVTALAKHYLAIATMQEGSLLPEPRKDFKGVGFRSSTYPKIVVKEFDQFIVRLFALIEKAEPIRAGSILKHIAGVEKSIYDSIISRHSDYLQTVSIKRREEYADAGISTYFYYELWTEVFAKDYGEMIIPNKCYKIPLKGGKRLFKDPVFLEKMKEDHPKLHQRLMAFIEKNPKRDISQILIPPSKGSISPFFVEIMDIRAHISSVMAGYYHVLDALDIGTTDIRVNGLVSDFYDPSAPLLDDPNIIPQV